MKSVFLFIFLCLATPAIAQLTYQNLEVAYDSAIEYRNLKIIPIVQKGNGSGSPFISLGRAIKEGKVVVSERGTASTENVHWLRINNKTKIPLFIASGEIILGGRQDRLVTRDTVLIPTGGDQYVAVMCVEEDRWSDKEKKFAYYNYANPRLRKVVGQSGNQVRIWKEIYDQLDSNKIKAPTLSYAAQRADKKISLLQDEYNRYFDNRISQSDSGWVGFVVMSGNRILGAEVFDSPALFYDQLMPLLQGFIEDAILKGSPSQVPDERVRKWLDPLLRDEATQEQHLKAHGKRYKFEGRTIHITAFGE